MPHSKSNREPDQLKDHWFCALSALAVLAAVISTGPILEMGINDDWTYAHSALKLAQTGRLTYNGWGAAFLGVQALWGAWAIHLFGFSFTVLRLSILPFAMGCSIVLFWLSRRLGLNPSTALFGTLTVSLSPLFIPLATSFMTDVPALFFLLLSLLAFTAALQAEHRRGYMAWLATAAFAGIAGGTVRQIGYITPLILMPVVAFASRKRSHRFGLPYATSLWILSLLTWMVCSQWQKQQPYSVPMDMVANFCRTMCHLTGLLRAVISIISIFSAATLFILPVALVYVVSRIRMSNARQIGVALLLTVLLFVGLQPVAGPLMGNTVTQYGILDSGTDALGLKPVVLSNLARGAVIALVYLTFAFAILRMRQGVGSWFGGVAAALDFRRWEDRPAALILVPFSVAYIATLVLFADWIFDRYVLPLLAVCVIAFLLSCQSWISSKILTAGYVGVLFCSLYAIATTHDYLAAARARAAAARHVEDAGIPRTSITAGFEYDAWTQLMHSGHVDLRFPVQGFRFRSRPKEENYWFWDYTPVVQPKYFVVYSSQPALMTASFPRIGYTAWLPPFRREVLVQMLPPGE